MVCTVDCLTTYGCGTPSSPTDGAIFSPYVKLQFGNGNNVITVGNNASPPVNQAVISSFRTGWGLGTPSFGAEFEILDVGGVLYPQIIQALNKTLTTVNQEANTINFDFGWIIKNCSGQVSMRTAYSLTGMSFHGIFTGVEQTYEGGKVKLKVTLSTPCSKVPDVRHNDTLGSEDQKIPLKEALTKLFTTYNPTFNSVQFINKDGGMLCFKSSDGGCNGPLGAWPINQQNSLSAARTWLSSITTINNLGILILYDPNTNSIVFQEDPNQGTNCCGQNVSTLYPGVGTYIVNGGNCSGVLEFNPHINWPLGYIPGAGAATGGAASAAGTPVEPTIPIQEAGTESSPTVQQHEWMWRNPESLASGAAEGLAAHLEANQKYEVPGGWQAELKIFGDPTYASPLELVGKTVSIIVINPFFVGNQCTWITTSNCNSIMSNKNYMILGVDHQINGGSFVTTLKLMLLQPNKDIPATDPLGGCGTVVFNGPVGASEATDAE